MNNVKFGFFVVLSSVIFTSASSLASAWELPHGRTQSRQDLIERYGVWPQTRFKVERPEFVLEMEPSDRRLSLGGRLHFRVDLGERFRGGRCRARNVTLLNAETEMWSNQAPSHTVRVTVVPQKSGHQWFKLRVRYSCDLAELGRRNFEGMTNTIAVFVFPRDQGSSPVGPQR